MSLEINLSSWDLKNIQEGIRKHMSTSTNASITEIYDNFQSKLYWNIIKNYRDTLGFSGFVDCFVERENYKLGINFIEEIKKDREEFIDSFPEDKKPSSLLTNYSKFFSKNKTKYLDMIKEELPFLDDEWQISNNPKVLATLLDLSPEETRILQFSMFFNSWSYQYTQPFIKIANDDEYKDLKVLYSLIFDIDKKQVGDIFKGFLFKSGFLRQSEYTRPFFVLADELEPYFSDIDIDISTIEDTLFPTVLNSTLSTKLYPHISEEINICKRIISDSLDNNLKGTNILFWGLPGTGKTELAMALAKEAKVTIRSVGDISTGSQEELSRTQRLVSLKLAMKIYEKRNDVVLLFDEMEDIAKGASGDGNKEENYSKAFINRIIETTPVPIIWTTNTTWTLGQAILRRMDYNIEFNIPNSTARLVIWKKYVKDYSLTFTKDEVKSLAHNYDIIPAAIKNAAKVSAAGNLSYNETIDVIKNFDKLVNFGRERKFTITKNSDTPYDLSVVNTKTDLVSLVKQLKKAKSNWSMCLYGPPGTGKSEFGRHIAEELGKLVLFKRASDLESMWVGETEKNIAKAFAEASKDGKVLIIDEGDSFLRGRSSSNKSWENSKVNEVLSQMETHDQPFIITTNLFETLDPASLRRFTFKLHFDFLKPEMAAKLFKEYFNVKAPDAILNQRHIAPGDFSNVKKKATILGIKKADELYSMLMEEVSVKPEARTKIGF